MNRPLSLQAALLVLLWSSIASADGSCPDSARSRLSGYGAARIGYVHPPAAFYPPMHRGTVQTAAPVSVFRQPAGAVDAITRSPAAPVSLQPAVATPADRVTAAMHAFQLGNHHEAIVLVDTLIKDMPGSADLLQFRGLIQLRTGDLKKSAFDTYEALNLGTIWNTAQVEKIYGDAQRYANDLRMLRLLAQSNPQELELQFLAAYHHLVVGDLPSGRKALDRVLALRPNEPVAVALVRLIDSQSGALTAARSGHKE
jgi:predicted Zn-dependent protease